MEAPQTGANGRRIARPRDARKVVFLISAQLQSGKDTLGQMLLRACGGGARFAFADPVKEACIAMLGMPSHVAYGSEEERQAWTRYGRNAREWFRHIGTEFGRNGVHKRVWIDRLLERIAQTACKFIIVPDARFKNELAVAEDAELAKHFHFVKIRIRRTGSKPRDGHVSEQEQLEIPDDYFDHVVENNGTPEELEAKAKTIAATYCA